MGGSILSDLCVTNVSGEHRKFCTTKKLSLPAPVRQDLCNTALAIELPDLTSPFDFGFVRDVGCKAP